MKPLCIYHGGCDDGFAAAWCVRSALGNEVEFYPGVYQKDPPPHDGRNVILVDLSYKRPILEEMVSRANSVLILDHRSTILGRSCWIYFEVEPGKFQYSLRSRGDFDVSEIAGRFGGGGHKNAAGFSSIGISHEVSK